MKKYGKFPRPGMVASGESSTPFSGQDVKPGYQPYGWNTPVGGELDYAKWGNTGIGGQKGPLEGSQDSGMNWTDSEVRRVRQEETWGGDGTTPALKKKR